MANSHFVELQISSSRACLADKIGARVAASLVARLSRVEVGCSVRQVDRTQVALVVDSSEDKELHSNLDLHSSSLAALEVRTRVASSGNQQARTSRASSSSHSSSNSA